MSEGKEARPEHHVLNESAHVPIRPLGRVSVDNGGVHCRRSKQLSSTPRSPHHRMFIFRNMSCQIKDYENLNCRGYRANICSREGATTSVSTCQTLEMFWSPLTLWGCSSHANPTGMLWSLRLLPSCIQLLWMLRPKHYMLYYMISPYDIL